MGGNRGTTTGDHCLGYSCRLFYGTRRIGSLVAATEVSDVSWTPIVILGFESEYMPSVNLLNTTTVNFLDLVGNGKTYNVPRYQRDYSWTEEQWEDLWLDIEELRKDSDSHHYMGAVVAKVESDRHFMIIDGQQRIATLTILALAIINHLKTMADQGVTPEDNHERSKALRSRFIGEKDPASLTEISKLILNEHDNGFFQDYLVQLREPANPRALTKSNRVLWDCFAYFRKCILGVPTLHVNGLAVAGLLSETIARQLMFILITVDNDLSAYTIFETLNARGLELTTTDLLKNYLFSRISTPSDLEAVQRRWQKLVTTVQQHRFADFLRYHYLTKHRKIRSGRLFKMIREEVRSAEEAMCLLIALEKRADLFDAIGDSSHAFWNDLPEAKEWIRELQLYRVRQMTPLLFAAWEKFSRTDFVRILKLVATISFRYTVVSGLNTNELEPIYHDAAKAILSEAAESPRDVYSILAPIYLDDTRFEANFSEFSVTTNGPRKRLARYILAKLETDAGHFCDPEVDPSSVEHILPENPSVEWDEFIPQNRWDEFTMRIGNLCLIEPSINREIGNQPFAIKLDGYRRSSYVLTSKIADEAPEEWTIEQLQARQRRLARRAVHVWRSDFAV